MNTIQVPLPRVLIMQTDKASREEVAGMLSRYGYRRAVREMVRGQRLHPIRRH